MSNPKPLYDAAIRAYETKNFHEAEKLARQLVAEYPESNIADSANKLIRSIEKRRQQHAARAKEAKDSASDEVYTEAQWSDVSVAQAAQPSGQYTTTRTLASFFSFVGWVLVAIGVLAGFMAFAEYGVAGLASGVVIAFFGLLQVMGGQLIRATVDTADNTLKILHALNGKK